MDAGVPQHPLEPAAASYRIPQKILKRVPEWHRLWAEIWWVQIEDVDYVFRSPTRGDAVEHDLDMLSSPVGAQDAFVKKCLLMPDDLDEDMSLEAFLRLYKVIWDVSGLRNPEILEEKLYYYEQAVNSPDQSYILLLMKAFQGRLIPDDIKDWQPEKILYHAAIARTILGLDPLKPPPQKAPGGPVAPPPRPQPKQQYFDWVKDKQAHEDFLG